jgi:hypothetical protein
MNWTGKTAIVLILSIIVSLIAISFYTNFGSSFQPQLTSSPQPTFVPKVDETIAYNLGDIILAEGNEVFYFHGCSYNSGSNYLTIGHFIEGKNDDVMSNMVFDFRSGAMNFSLKQHSFAIVSSTYTTIHLKLNW